MRRLLGVLSLVDTPGAAADEGGCAAALALQVARLPLRLALARAAPAASLTLRQVAPLSRDLTHDRDLIARRTQEETPT